MHKFRVSLEGDSLEDSRGETEVDRLREEIKRKHATIQEKDKIISSLRQQVGDFECENEQLETEGQVMRQKIDRLKKELNEKEETIEALSHAQKEIDTANENLTRRLNARMAQVQKYCDDLTKTKQDLEAALAREEEHQNKIELLSVELDSARRSVRERANDLDEVQSRNLQDLMLQVNNLKQQNAHIIKEAHSMKEQHLKLIDETNNLKQQNAQLISEAEKVKRHSSLSHNSNSSDCEHISHEELIQELYNLRAQVKSLSHRQSRRSIDEEIMKLKQELEVTETSWRLERQHKERYARENLMLDKKVNDLTKEVNNLRADYMELEKKSKQAIPSPPQPDQHENDPRLTSAIRYTVHEEVGEIMDTTSLPAPDKLSGQTNPHYCANHRIKKSQFISDPIAEQKMRMERANELARRNMQTKPLHQTSYPLELDTFDTTDITENDIKRGRVTNNRRMQVLNDSSNQQRRPVKKAEAFVV